MREIRSFIPTNNFSLVEISNLPDFFKDYTIYFICYDKSMKPHIIEIEYMNNTVNVYNIKQELQYSFEVPFNELIDYNKIEPIKFYIPKGYEQSYVKRQCYFVHGPYFRVIPLDYAKINFYESTNSCENIIYIDPFNKQCFVYKPSLRKFHFNTSSLPHNSYTIRRDFGPKIIDGRIFYDYEQKILKIITDNIEFKDIYTLDLYDEKLIMLRTENKRRILEVYDLEKSKSIFICDITNDIKFSQVNKEIQAIHTNNGTFIKTKSDTIIFVGLDNELKKLDIPKKRLKNLERIDLLDSFIVLVSSTKSYTSRYSNVSYIDINNLYRYEKVKREINSHPIKDIILRTNNFMLSIYGDIIRPINNHIDITYNEKIYEDSTRKIILWILCNDDKTKYILNYENQYVVSSIESENNNFYYYNILVCDIIKNKTQKFDLGGYQVF